MTMSPVYKKLSKTGAVLTWQIENSGDGRYRTHSGQENGAITISEWTTCEPKNLGQSNETSPGSQAELEIKAKITKKLDEGYALDLSQANAWKSPMLAHEYKKVTSRKPLTMPVYTQPKLDGCLFKDSVLTTEDGPARIENIVRLNRVGLKVLSYNEKTREQEFKPIINVFDNGKAPFSSWLEITPVGGKRLKCTSNHKLITKRGWVEAGLLEKDDVLLTDISTSQKYYRFAGAMLGDSAVSFEKRGNGSYRITFGHANKELFEEKVRIFGLTNKVQHRMSGYGSAMLAKSTPVSIETCPIDIFYHLEDGPEQYKRRLLSAETLDKVLNRDALAIWIADDGSISYNNGNRNTPRLTLNTQRYSVVQINEFVRYFEKYWQCTPSINTDKKVESTPGHFIVFTTKDTLYLLNHLKNEHLKGVEYKFYFPTEGYIEDLKTGLAWRPYIVKKSRNCAPMAKYDIEVADNHNYIANGTVVHNCRMVVTKDGAFSRNGKTIHTVPHILEALKPVLTLYPGLEFDGEIYNHDFKNDFNSLISLAKKTKPTLWDLSESRKYLQYWVYDTRNPNLTFKERLDQLTIIRKEHFKRDCSVRQVYTTLCRSQEELDYNYEVYLLDRFEGQMVRSVEGKYEFNRSNHLLKRKEFIEEEFEILDIIEGIGNRSGIAGAASFQKDGKPFRAGLIGSYEYCKDLLDNKSKYIGQMATVKYFNLTPATEINGGVPRFPYMKTLRNYE